MLFAFFNLNQLNAGRWSVFKSEVEQQLLSPAVKLHLQPSISISQQNVDWKFYSCFILLERHFDINKFFPQSKQNKKKPHLNHCVKFTENFGKAAGTDLIALFSSHRVQTKCCLWQFDSGVCPKNGKKSISGYNLSVTTRSQFSYQLLVPTCWGSFSRGVVISRLCFNSGKKSLPKKRKKEHNKSLLLHSLGFSSPTLFFKRKKTCYSILTRP